MNVANPPITNPNMVVNPQYQTVAASQTGKVLGTAGAKGDFIAGILIVPATTSPGNIVLIDGSTSITIFTGGATSVQGLAPIYVTLCMFSSSGPWSITTGANVSIIAMGSFSV